jgi:hypothetical protein
MLTLSYYVDGSNSSTSLVALVIIPVVIMVFGVGAFALVRKKVYEKLL